MVNGTFTLRGPIRSYSQSDIEAFLAGSTNPYLEPLKGKEAELRAWLEQTEVEEKQEEARNVAKARVEAAYKNLQEAESDLDDAREQVRLCERELDDAKDALIALGSGLVAAA